MPDEETRESAGPSAEEQRQHAQLLAARYHCEFVDLTRQRVDSDLFRLIPVDLMFRYHFIPLEATDGTLVVAMADPSQFFVADDLAVRLGRNVVIKVASQEQIADILKKSEQSQRVLEEVTEGFRLDVVREGEEGEEGISVERLTRETEGSPVVRLVDSILFNALERRASDVHVETRDVEVVVKYRIDGVLHPAMAPLAQEWHSAIISRIKVMSELDIAERRIPQDGRFRVRYKGRAIDFRVSIMPSIFGEDAVLRILDKESLSEKFRHLNLDVIGFTEMEKTKLRRYIREPYGMLLVTGPTGSGKTTTLYACLSEIKTDEDKLVTIEDPVEYQIRGVTQIQVNERKGLTFARGLRSILRHDPDKIMVGEIRDLETAQIAIQSALTGHLVFTTVHANNVVDVIGRFLNMGVEAYNFVSALNCILAQRLVRIICENCRHEVQYSREAMEESGLPYEKWKDVPFYEGTGCLECHGTGFRGRTAICELLDLSDRIRQMIVDKKPTSEIKHAAREEGMIFLREAGLDKVRQGITSLRELNKVTFIESM